MIGKIWESIKNLLSYTPGEPNPWNKDAVVKKEITQEEITEAVKEMGMPKLGKSYGLIFVQGFTILWIIAHFGLLYVGIGTPLSIGILIYVMINFFIFSHYLILLRPKKEVDNDE